MSPTTPTLDWARGVGEEIAAANDRGMSRSDASWRSRPVSDAQRVQSGRVGILAKPGSMNRGKASDLLTAKYATRDVRRICWWADGERSQFADVPPHDLTAEQAVVGAMMLSRDAITDVWLIIGPDAHYRAAHQVIHETVLELDDAGAPADVIAVADRLTARRLLGKVGGGPAPCTPASRWSPLSRTRPITRRSCGPRRSPGGSSRWGCSSTRSGGPRAWTPPSSTTRRTPGWRRSPR